jgi:hypothetical protein
MKFTRYFSGVIKNQGIPHINVKEYQKLFNIISLEIRIDELTNLKREERSQDRKYSYDIRINDLQRQVNRLTMENSPQNVLKYMINESRFEN